MNIVEIVILSLFILCICVNIATLTGFIQKIKGESMNPTFENNNLVLALPIISKIKRNDVVFFDLPELKKKNYIKRVIALPGETVQIKMGSIYINGKQFNEDIVFKTKKSGLANKPIKLQQDEYFVLGDNRNDSIDSRSFGPIKRTYIKRRVYTKICLQSDHKNINFWG